MAAGAPLQFKQTSDPITDLTVTMSDGAKYDVKIAIVVQAVIDSGMTNPIDKTPILNVVTQTVMQIKLAIDG